MPSRAYKTRSPSHKPTRAIESEKVQEKRAKQKLAKEIEDELDALLDEVDDIITENQEVLANYKQIGGE